MKREKLEWLAKNPRYTKRFAIAVGRRCRESPIKDVAEEFHLDWQTVKKLDMEYMEEQLKKQVSLLFVVLELMRSPRRRGTTIV